MNQRSSGILLHLTSLANDFPIGDLGPAAFSFVDFLKMSGQRWWEVLATGPTKKNNSPYKSSAFAGNSLLISPDGLVEQGFLTRHDIEFFQVNSKNFIDYKSAKKLKWQWLKKAFFNFEKNIFPKSEFNEFVQTEFFWLEDHSLFMALQEKFHTPDWTTWPDELRTRQVDALHQAKKELENEIRFHHFVQFQFEIQLKKLKMFCTQQDIHLIGDLPFFVTHQSADVWAHSDIFKLDREGKPLVSAGVPPDYFSPTGQLWRVPVYRWDVLQQQHYAWWIARLQKALKQFDAVRLDHFIGFVRTYEIPTESTSAEHGTYQPSAGFAFFDAVQKALGRLPFIADDLGAITPEVKKLRDQFNLPGTYVLQFEFDPAAKVNPFLPDHYPVNSLVYTATHDNDTTAGWYKKLSNQEKAILRKQLGAKNDEIHWAMMQAAFASKAKTAIIPMQDVLGLGSKARMNTPGKEKGNWQWRLNKDDLTLELAHQLLELTNQYGRKLP